MEICTAEVALSNVYDEKFELLCIVTPVGSDWPLLF